MRCIDLCSYDSADSVGGPLAWLRRMPPLLRERGVEVRILLFSWDIPEDGSAYQYLAEKGFEVRATRFSTTDENVRWLLEQAHQRRPDVFIANHVVPAWHAAGFLRRAGIPTIGVLRSDEAFYHDLTERFVFGSHFFQPSAVVAVSRHLAESVASRNPRHTLVRHIPSGTPIPTPGSERPLKPFRIAWVGRLAQEQKRIRETVEALVRATGESPDTEAVLIGDGPEREWVRERLLGADAGRVSWSGALDPEEVSPILAKCHAIALLSDYEGTPTAIMEGMAAGCVPICTRMESGIPDLIQDGVTGILVENRGDAFVAAVGRLAEDRELLARISDAARSRAKTEFSLDTCADRWMELCEELTEAAGKGREVAIPKRLRLLRPLPGFAHQDPRPPGWSVRARHRMARIRFHAGRWKKLLDPQT